jgi:beta-carotene ketolase (CrtW type)
MTGFFISVFIIGSWIFTVTYGLFAPQVSWQNISLFDIALAFLIQLLGAGLFITTHDACHGSLSRERPRLNLWTGRVSAFLYAGFIFDRLKTKHAEHHRAPGTQLDPDFAAEGVTADKVVRSAGYLQWFISFFKNYLELYQLLTMVAVSQILIHGFHFPLFNVFLFWVIPSVLSAVQLFTFGTYFPHRVLMNSPFTDHHRARNTTQSFARSLLSCYHFGAWHLRHHQTPSVPWFLLPFK